MRIERVRIRRLAVGESAEVWGSALTNPAWLEGAGILKSEGGDWVRAATLADRPVVVKARRLRGAGQRLRARLGLGRGDRHWAGAALLRKEGVATAQPLGLGTARVDGRPYEVLVLERLEGPTLLQVMRDIRDGRVPIRDQLALAAAVARQIADLGWLFNRDHKPSNIIVTRLGEGGTELAIIDCVGVRSRRLLGSARMWASLVLEPLGCGVLPRRALLMRALAEHRRIMAAYYDPNDDLAEDDGKIDPPSPEWDKRVWREVAALVAAHGDPRPKVNPLGERRSDG
jgi:hypothetical protein